ncbi:MAG TPA: hypothetical protein VHM26_12430, partial [Chitinophagaceae bacterium]|nr:hypothetical protein [Chitinophagaceae bacterium]
WTFWPARNNDPHNSSYSRYAIVFFLIAAFGNLYFINNDLWQDELYTLDNFVLVPLSRTVSDYHTTNNHVTFNVICNVYCKLIGVKDLRQLLENPWIIRVVPYFFSLMAIPLLYNSVRKIQGELMSIITLAVYTSSLVFYTFGVQVRGYSLGLALCILLINLVLTYRVQPRMWRLAAIALTGFLVLINLPSTIYFFTALMIVLFAASFFPLRQITLKSVVRSLPFKIVIALAWSFLACALFFYTKKEQLSQNSLLGSSGNSIVSLIKQPIVVFGRFIDWRIILVLPVIFLFWRPWQKLNRFQLSLFYITALLLPFLLYVFHNPVIILRIWIVLFPMSCCLVAQLWFPLLKESKQRVILFVISLFVISAFSFMDVKRQTVKSYINSARPLDLRQQYHLFGFHPRRIIQKATEYSKRDHAEVMIYDETISGIQYYIDKSGLDTTDNPTFNRRLFLIADNINAPHILGIQPGSIIDSGSHNRTELYKWYLVKSKNEQ